MSESSKKPNETYLGYIQSTITRMGQNAFQAKAWCITVVAAVLIFYLGKDASGQHLICTIIACAVTALFCLLDSYYLYLERGYRKLYQYAAGLESISPPIRDYDMQIPKNERSIWQYLKALFSISTGLFYGAIILLLIVLWWRT
ncbi:MAG: hypothetical protein UIL73_03335 [Anaerovoracaceae bacterium]|nr:hypothetical protein [Anaerovoracaceae bacterium]